MNNNERARLLSAEKIDLTVYWKTIKRSKWWIFGFVSLVFLITAYAVYSMKPIYKATAILLIEAQQAKVVSIEEVYGLDTRNSEYYATQFEILKSRELAEKVVERFDLFNHFEYNPALKRSQARMSLSRLLDFFGNSTAEKINVDKDLTEEEMQDVVSQFLNNLSISPIKKTQLVKITFESHDPKLASDAANALADAYIESHLDAKLQMTRKATTWLTGRMESLKSKLSEAETALQAFRDKENLIDIEGVRSLASKQLQGISTKLISVREKRSELENQYKQVQAIKSQDLEEFESIPAVINNSFIQNLKVAEAKAERRIAEIGKRYGPQHPKMKALKSKLSSAQTKIDRQVKTIIGSIEKEYQVAIENEISLAKSLDKSKREIQSINRKEFQLRELEREVETNRKLYNTFFTRFQETSATQDLKSVNARIMDPAVKPRSPSKPKKSLTLAITLILSFIIAILTSLLREGMNKTLKSAEDVELKLGFPVLGLVPLANAKWRQQMNPAGVFTNPDQASFAEAMRSIRTSIILSGLDEPQKITLVTSSLPNEGKTTISATLGIALGQIERVLLIDCDMRRPSVGKAFNLDRKMPGLANYVAKTNSLEECVHRFGNTGLDIMPAGLTPPNPLEMLSSKRFADVLEGLAKIYDRIVIDSGPIHIISDPLVLSPIAHSLIYVVKAGETDYNIVKSGLKRLSDVNASITGVVLNQYDEKKMASYGNYAYTYKEEVKEDKTKSQQSLQLSVPKFN